MSAVALEVAVALDCNLQLTMNYSVIILSQGKYV